MIGLPLMAMKIAAAYHYSIWEPTPLRWTSLASRAKSSCEFGRPEVKDFGPRFLESTDVNGNLVLVVDPEPQVLEDTQIFATWILVGEVVGDALGTSLLVDNLY